MRHGRDRDPVTGPWIGLPFADEKKNGARCRVVILSCDTVVPKTNAACDVDGGRSGIPSACNTCAPHRAPYTRNPVPELGLDIRPSHIHGCGLFATRPFLKGDVLIPYTGDVVDAPPRPNAYTYALRPGFVDASCLRGAAAYANGNRHGRRDRPGIHNNVTVHRCTVNARTHFATFVPDPANPKTMRVTAAFFRNAPRNWRRIPKVLLDAFHDQPHLWLVAKEPIPAGREIIVDYNNSDLAAMDHKTEPLPCSDRSAM